MKIRKKNHTSTEQRRRNGTHMQGDTRRLPIDATTDQPLAPCTQPGYYPGFQTLSQKAFWDEATRKVVLARVEHVPPIRFCTHEEAQLMQAVCDRLLPQNDRDEAHKIPLVNSIDERLYSGRIDGYRFEDMPLCVGRGWLWWPCLSTWLYAPGRGQTRTLGGGRTTLRMESTC